MNHPFDTFSGQLRFGLMLGSASFAASLLFTAAVVGLWHLGAIDGLPAVPSFDEYVRRLLPG